MTIPDTSKKIAAAALAILEKEGADAISMRRVAKAVGVTPMALYHHFESREALLAFVTNREFERLVDYMRAQPQARGHEQRLLHIMDYYIDYAFDHPRIFDYVFAQDRGDARKFPRDFIARRSPTMNVVADAVEAAMKDGFIARDDVWNLAMDLWAHVHGYIVLYRAGRFGLSENQFRQLCQHSLKRLLDGLRN
jgi:AcrR family transcriptional regulator